MIPEILQKAYRASAKPKPPSLTGPLTPGKLLRGVGFLGQGYGIYEAANQLRQGNYAGALGSAALSFPQTSFGLLKNPGVLAAAGGLLAMEALGTPSTAAGEMSEAQLEAERKQLQKKAKEKLLKEKLKKEKNTEESFTPIPLVEDRFIATEENLNTLPPSPEQSIPMDPYAYNLQVYGQGREAAKTPEQRNKVKELGLEINRQLFPQFNNTKTINPLLQKMFPERYPATIDAAIKEKGIQAPATMTNITAQTDIIAGNNSENRYQLAQRTKDVQEFLKQAQLKVQTQQEL